MGAGFKIKGSKMGWGGVGALMSVLFPVLPGGHFSPSLLGGRERGRGGVDQCLNWGEVQGRELSADKAGKEEKERKIKTTRRRGSRGEG